MGRRTNQYRWQAPGNGRLFDSRLKDWENNLMSQRCVGVLQFLEDNPLIEKELFEVEIAPYLERRFGHQPNDSIKAHFYRPLEFIGFMRNMDDLLSLSIDGKNFLNAMLDEDYDSALESYVLQLLKASYPNHATDDIDLALFPFRIMFKLLSKNSPHNGEVPKKMFYTDIPFIINLSDINPLLNKLSDTHYLYYLEHSSLKDLKLNSKNFYEKWYIWVVASLREMNIVEETGRKSNSTVRLASPIDEFIEGIVDKMHYEDMFFESSKDYSDLKNNIRCKPRNPNVIQTVLEDSEYSCFFDKTHITFESYNRPNYVEGHHVIPVALNDSFDEELDCEDNVIALCPNCHKAIHYATNEHKEDLLKYIIDNDVNLSRFDITLEDLKEFYFTRNVKVTKTIEFKSSKF
ncbi:HNH endonuclease [Methanobrevibacter sp.]|uniref:HNH endonuclease n=1 Tax=Methanobrevibacter sp. TaxID=66852 RepID=UPI00386D1E34